VKGEGSREVDHIERRKVDHIGCAGGPRASSRSSRLFDKATAMLWLTRGYRLESEPLSVVADNALSVSQAEKLTGMPKQRVYLRRRTAASFLTALHAASRRPGARDG
jgi:hypothetical protein